MTQATLTPGVAKLTPQTSNSASKNVYQNMTEFRYSVVIYCLAWAFLIGIMLTGTFLGIYALILMFPLSAAIVGFINPIQRYVQGKMLTRICEPGSEMFQHIGKAFTTAGSKLAIWLAVLVFPFWLPFLWLQDLKRLMTLAKLRSKGEKVSFGSDEFTFYKKQAKKYNQILQSQGKQAAENFLMITTVLTDIPNAAEIAPHQWNNGIRDEIVSYKERKYGPMASFGV